MNLLLSIIRNKRRADDDDRRGEVSTNFMTGRAEN